MPLNLVKLAVGITDIDHLKIIQTKKLQDPNLNQGNKKTLYHITRNTPRRYEEIVNGGSLYWVIKRVIQVRQLITGVESIKKTDGKSSCALILDPVLSKTVPRPFRPFQGWRYLTPDMAPEDLPSHENKNEQIPYKLAKELQNLGLL